MNFIKSLVLGLTLSLASLAAFAAQINLNTASAAQLETLNGIGAAKAEAGPKTVEKNRDQMTVAAK